MYVGVSKSRSVRYTEAAGAAYVGIETEEAERIEEEAPVPPGSAEKMVMSADGAMVPLLHGEWAEVKTLVIGEVAPAVKEGDEWTVHTRKLSYFSRLVDAERFKHLTLVEIQRRGLEHSREVAMLGDGAEWVQHLADYHRSDALRILDFPHAGQRIGEIGQALYGEGDPQTSQWTTERLHQLKHEGPTSLLAELLSFQKQYPGLEILENNAAYLQKREAQMQYPVFQQQGWPIASSIAESANKLVVEARLKGSGMHWERQHVDPMLALRNIICSDRWVQEWPRIAKRLRLQETQRRRRLCEKHRLAKQPVCLEVSLPPLSELDIEHPAQQTSLSITPDTPQETQKSSMPWRPAPNHPWRHSPIGRARYATYPNAKN